MAKDTNLVMWCALGVGALMLFGKRAPTKPKPAPQLQADNAAPLALQLAPAKGKVSA